MYFVQFIQCLWNKRLVVEVWVYGYQQDYIQFVYDVIEIIEWCCWVEYQFCFIVVFFNQLQCVVNMFGGFWVKGNDVCVSGGKVGYDMVDWFDYQVDINRCGNIVLMQGFQYYWVDSQVWYIVIIYDVKVYNISIGSQCFGGVFIQVSKIS